jgi:hypothetical protein
VTVVAINNASRNIINGALFQIVTDTKYDEFAKDVKKKKTLPFGYHAV